MYFKSRKHISYTLTVSTYHEESPTKRQQHKEQHFTDLLDGHSQ